MKSLKQSMLKSNRNPRTHGILLRAMTLLEVVVALAILGTVLAALIVAHSRLLHQTQLAKRRMEAVPIADRLLESWWQNPDDMPRDAEGVQGDYRWHAYTREDGQATEWGVDILILDLWYEGERSVVSQPAAGHPEPDYSIELFIPTADEEKQEVGEPA